MLNIEKKINATAMTMCISGRLDTTTAPQLEEELNSHFDNITEIVMDIEHLEYISSAGLRVILSVQKMMNKQGNLVIKHVRSEIMEIFEITGFVDILNIE